MTRSTLMNGTLLDGSRVNIELLAGAIESVAAAGPATGDAVDLDGYLVLPAAIEPHAHLDKAFLAEDVDNPTGDLMGAIEAMNSRRDVMDIDGIVRRAERAARLLAHNGFTHVRTHADTMVGHGLRSVEALAEVRRRVTDLIDIEIVALGGWPLTGRGGADNRALLRDALDAGADLVGGCPHLEGDIRAATDVLLDLAADRGRSVDLHTDETLDPSADGLAVLAERVLSGFPHAATASHCVSLGQQPLDVQRRTAERVAEAGVNVVALPHTNLFPQGRGATPMPRGLTAVDVLRAAGATVAAGADNLQDPFNPVGRGCPFETAGLMIMAAHLLPDDAWATVSAAPALTLGLDASGIVEGARADLLCVRAASVREAIAFGPTDRIVWRRGQRLG